MSYFILIIFTLILGAAHRRWLGSARPSWAWTGYRATQIAAGFIVLALLQVVRGDPLWRCALDSALAIGFMTLPIAISRQPFVWLARKLNLPTTERLPHPFKTMLQGVEPWGEAIQGGALWMLAVAF